MIIGYRHICLRLTNQPVDVDGSSRTLAFIAKALKAPIFSPHLFQDLLYTAALLTGSQDATNHLFMTSKLVSSRVAAFRLVGTTSHIGPKQLFLSAHTRKSVAQMPGA